MAGAPPGTKWTTHNSSHTPPTTGFVAPTRRLIRRRRRRRQVFGEGSRSLNPAREASARRHRDAGGLVLVGQ